MHQAVEEVSCPLGSTCYEIKDNKPIRCAWHINIAGKDAQGNDVDEYKCAITWMPILQIESSSTNRGVSTAIETMTATQTENNHQAIQMMLGVANAKTIEYK